MYKAIVNGKEYEIEMDARKKTINGKEFIADLIELKNGRFHIIHDYKSYSVEVVEINREEKIVIIKVNNREYKIAIKDQYDELLHQLGMDKGTSKHGGDVKAPMPGLVLNVMVEHGQQIKKGDALVVLEAMKMENILKASADGQVKKIMIRKGDKVEKNQVMISME